MADESVNMGANLQGVVVFSVDVHALLLPLARWQRQYCVLTGVGVPLVSPPTKRRRSSWWR